MDKNTPEGVAGDTGEHNKESVWQINNIRCTIKQQCL